MDRDTIIRLARECDLPDWQPVGKNIERFAALVAAHEREACAKVCDSLRPSEREFDARYWDAAEDCADAIRSRT